MLSRFAGREGRRVVVDALRDQPVIGEDADLAETICDRAEILGFDSGTAIIEEDAPDDDMYFILSGAVSVRVGGREVGVRAAGQHIGEMAVVDPGQPRSASVVAEGEVVAARVSAIAFASLAESNPRLWRNVARGLARRLRQRNRFVRSVNPRPVMFVGCSTESLPIGEAVQSALSRAPIVVRLWTEDVFEASSFPIESLEHELHRVDFAALVLSPDDMVISRDQAAEAPRDNIVFELGLFMGALGHDRTFLIYPRGVDIKIPTDLAGITALTYEPGPPCGLTRELEAACRQLRKQVLAAGPL